ncbi:hypothetical protein [Micromonospora sp. NPDC048898]|uniref:hypothetical protein n=1 Tax=Micromonospora sp. NPDC048898 TaxID=3364260 RepID=UPI00371F88F7
MILKRQPPTLAAAYDEATATVLAEVKGVRKGRVLKDLQWVAVELRVIEVLSGNLRPELGKKVDVEFPVEFLPEPVDPVVDAMRSTLPKGPAVWLLQWEGSLATPTKPGAPSNPSVDLSMYVTVHPNTGVFIQGPQGVVAATAQEKHDGLSARGAEAEGQRFATVNELADHVRQNR